MMPGDLQIAFVMLEIITVDMIKYYQSVNSKALSQNSMSNNLCCLFSRLDNKSDRLHNQFNLQTNETAIAVISVWVD